MYYSPAIKHGRSHPFIENVPIATSIYRVCSHNFPIFSHSFAIIFHNFQRFSWFVHVPSCISFGISSQAIAARRRRGTEASTPKLCHWTCRAMLVPLVTGRFFVLMKPHPTMEIPTFKMWNKSHLPKPEIWTEKLLRVSMNGVWRCGQETYGSLIHLIRDSHRTADVIGTVGTRQKRIDNGGLVGLSGLIY